MDEVPESREVWNHGEREFDRIDEGYTRLQCFLIGFGAGLLVAFALAFAF